MQKIFLCLTCCIAYISICAQNKRIKLLGVQSSVGKFMVLGKTNVDNIKSITLNNKSSLKQSIKSGLVFQYALHNYVTIGTGISFYFYKSAFFEVCHDQPIHDPSIPCGVGLQIPDNPSSLYYAVNNTSLNIPLSLQFYPLGVIKKKLNPYIELAVNNGIVINYKILYRDNEGINAFEDELKKDFKFRFRPVITIGADVKLFEKGFLNFSSSYSNNWYGFGTQTLYRKISTSQLHYFEFTISFKKSF